MPWRLVRTARRVIADTRDEPEPALLNTVLTSLHLHPPRGCSSVRQSTTFAT
jgi:hypothetical protein